MTVYEALLVVLRVFLTLFLVSLLFFSNPFTYSTQCPEPLAIFVAPIPNL